MKAPANTEMMTSAALDGGSILAGRLPERVNTVTAEVLKQLLRGERLEGLDAVYSSSTTRLAAVINYLAEKYEWAIFKDEKAHGCRDGRVSMVAVYYLLPSTIAEANKAGATAWCANVCAARLKRRTEAAQAKRNAEAINAARKQRQQSGQVDLFGGAAA
jgi:hypothetical protein